MNKEASQYEKLLGDNKIGNLILSCNIPVVYIIWCKGRSSRTFGCVRLLLPLHHREPYFLTSPHTVQNCSNYKGYPNSYARHILIWTSLISLCNTLKTFHAVPFMPEYTIPHTRFLYTIKLPTGVKLFERWVTAAFHVSKRQIIHHAAVLDALGTDWIRRAHARTASWVRQCLPLFNQSENIDCLIPTTALLYTIILV